MKTSMQALLAVLAIATAAPAQQRKIVYQDCVVGDCEISVINADGTNRVQLTTMSSLFRAFSAVIQRS